MGKRAKQGVNEYGISGMHYIILTLVHTFIYLFHRSIRVCGMK